MRRRTRSGNSWLRIGRGVLVISDVKWGPESEKAPAEGRGPPGLCSNQRAEDGLIRLMTGQRKTPVAGDDRGWGLGGLDAN